jgi:RNA polymerase sigma factor (sigma-70 family)
MNEDHVSMLNHHYHFILRWLMKMGSSKQDAEDIVQETMYKYFLYNESIQENTVKNWLFRVATNMYYDLVRKQRIRNNYLLTFHLEELIDEHTPEKALMNHVLLKDVLAVLDSLKPTYKQLLILKYCIGLKYSEISPLLQMSESSIKIKLFRARNKCMTEYSRASIRDSE